MSLLGDRLNWGRIPLIQRGQAAFDEQRPGGFWDRVARTVMRHPVISFVAAAGLLAVAAIPYFNINTGFSGVSTLPDSLEAKQAFLTLDREFSAGLISPAQVVIDGPVNSPEVQAGVDRLESMLANDASFGTRRTRPTRRETCSAGAR
jgi:RND superfamily putative drug exporter